MLVQYYKDGETPKAEQRANSEALKSSSDGGNLSSEDQPLNHLHNFLIENVYELEGNMGLVAGENSEVGPEAAVLGSLLREHKTLQSQILQAREDNESVKMQHDELQRCLEACRKEAGSMNVALYFESQLKNNLEKRLRDLERKTALFEHQLAERKLLNQETVDKIKEENITFSEQENKLAEVKAKIRCREDELFELDSLKDELDDAILKKNWQLGDMLCQLRELSDSRRAKEAFELTEAAVNAGVAGLDQLRKEKVALGDEVKAIRREVEVLTADRDRLRQNENLLTNARTHFSFVTSEVVHIPAKPRTKPDPIASDPGNLKRRNLPSRPRDRGWTQFNTDPQHPVSPQKPRSNLKRLGTSTILDSSPAPWSPAAKTDNHAVATGRPVDQRFVRLPRAKCTPAAHVQYPPTFAGRGAPLSANLLGVTVTSSPGNVGAGISAEPIVPKCAVTASYGRRSFHSVAATKPHPLPAYSGACPLTTGSFKSIRKIDLSSTRLWSDGLLDSARRAPARPVSPPDSRPVLVRDHSRSSWDVMVNQSPSKKPIVRSKLFHGFLDSMNASRAQIR